MSKREKINYEFIFDNEPDEETLKEAHRIIAEAYIKKYGVQNMKKVLKILENQQET